MPQSEDRLQKSWHDFVPTPEERLEEHSQTRYIPSKDREAGATEIRLAISDMTQPTRGGEVLRRSEELQRRVLEHDGVLIFNAKGNITFVNERGAEILGYSPEEMLGKEAVSFAAPQDREAFEGLTRPPLRGAWARDEFRFFGKDGIELWLQMSTNPLLDGSGNFIESLGMFRDITAQKRTEEALRKAKDELEVRVQERTAELERSNRELQDFAFVASHDLREPLRKIRAFADLLVLKSSSSLNEESFDYVSRIEKSATRMQMLLSSLLDYSRVTTKATPFKDVDLNKTVEVALSNLEITIRAKAAVVEVGRLPNIEGDRVQMVQLFQNLISNALKYHREGERPVARIYSRPIRKGSAGGKIIYGIFVEDSGIGFDEKFLDRIFAPFQRLHGIDQYEGLGMGLAICKKIVKRHGGSITAKSALGEGSTFIVSLPDKQN